MSVTTEVSFEDNNNFKALLVRSKDLARFEVVAGFPTDKKVGEPTETGSGHKPYQDMEDAARIANFHEKGTMFMPPRPFMRKMNKTELRRRVAVAAKDVLYKRKRIDHALIPVGKFMVDSMKYNIDTMIKPDLADSTVMKKGHDTLLHDTDQMYNSIKYSVRRSAL